ncbi:MAG: hypothetical protein JWO36_1644 [Myxococcales bacterium]|nr:hypothetical protein [Myxococcales bacterium]
MSRGGAMLALEYPNGGIMRFKTLLGALVMAGAVLSAPMGCATTGAGSLVVTEPPPPREEVVTYHPGFFWVHGHWERGGDRWHWDDGHWERERAGFIYGEGRWEHRGARYQWIEGAWRPRGGVVVRDGDDHDREDRDREDRD